MIDMAIKKKIQEYLFKKKWRKHNSHNETYPVGIFNERLVMVGRKTYGRLYVSMFNDNYKLKIGNFCSIGPEVCFLLSSDHCLNYISTFPFKVKYGVEEFEGISKGDIIVEDDVWIGYGAIILSGVHIAQGAVIAAGSVVTKDVPAYAIVAGNPAKVIKYRFEQVVIDELIKINFTLLKDDEIVKNMQKFYRIPRGISDIEWLPLLKSGEELSDDKRH